MEEEVLDGLWAEDDEGAEDLVEPEALGEAWEAEGEAREGGEREEDLVPARSCRPVCWGLGLRMLQKYVPSGRYGLAAIIGVVPASVAMIVAAWAYQWMMSFASAWSGKLALVLVVFMGFGAFWTARTVLRACHCRNIPVGGLIGGCAGLVGVLASHYFKCAMAIGYGAASDPGALLAWVVEDARGRHSGGWTVHAAFVWTLWVLELGLVVLMGFLGGWAGSREPYCESCGGWATEVAGRLAVRVGTDQLGAVAGAESFERLLALDEPGGDVTLKYTVRHCGGCGEVATLEVQSERQTTDKKGKPTTQTRALKSEVLLSREQVESLLSRGPRENS